MSLPKYAQKRIADLEREVFSLKEELNRKVEADDKTNIILNWDVLAKTQLYLPEDSRIKFMLYDTPWRNFIEVYATNGGIEVYSGDRLSIWPKSSNLFVVTSF